VNWLDRAACLEENPELFFPIGSAPPALEQEATAKTVCAGCGVRTECLAWALDTNQDAGVWGGLGEEERREIRRARRRREREARESAVAREALAADSSSDLQAPVVAVG
jgi:WhiB family transcriptional regulator, redox-sensing transcriptional regulator